MFCPKCEAEYRPEVLECGDCQVPLVEVLPPADEQPDAKFVEVFRTADAGLLPIIESILNGADIPFSMQGEEAALGLFPFGSVGGGMDGRRLGAIIRVAEEHVEAAKALLAEADEVPDFPASDDDESE